MKRWTPYHFAIPLTEGEIPMDKGGFRTVTDKSCSSALEAVVYCKDCKYSRKSAIPYLQKKEKWCNRLEINRPFEWFCADGVAKDINAPNKEGR